MLIGITMGDSSGVGPEILLKSWKNGELPGDVLAFGDRSALDFANARLQLNVPIHSVGSPGDRRAGVLNVRDFAMLDVSDIRPGELSAESGAAARAYVIGASQAALAGEIDAMVTLPMNKEATQLSDPTFVGHTELIGAVCGAKDVTIMLVSDALIVTHVSTHVSLREAIDRVKVDRVTKIIELTCGAVRRLRKDARVAVAGLNPHAGENGLFGREEIEEIRPVVKRAQAQGLPVEGPFPPDTLFYLAVQRKRFDAIVCMYHDQGHVPLKLLDFEGGVNVALGLPIIRTSVDHGTAFDIAYKGVASTRSLKAAYDLAVQMVQGGVPTPARS